MTVLLLHPSTAPFVQQVGRALYEANLLDQFATSIVDRPQSLLRNIACQICEVFDYNLGHQLQRRAVSEFPLKQVVNNPWHEIARLSLSRLHRDRRLADFVWEWAETSWDRWVAQKCLPEHGAVYGYEHASLATFKAARQKGLVCIYDVPAPEHEYVQNLMQVERAQNPDVITPYSEYIKQHQARRTERRRQEWNLAHLVIANSQFTKASYAQSGLDVSKVKVVPYGAPPVSLDGIKGGTANQGPVRFLWAGTFGVRKGAHHLLKAWRSLNPGIQARLDVFGAMALPASLIQDLPDSVRLSGTVPRSELYRHYFQADALIFPTLCDGFGMVVTEAFAQGLPVITTDRAGAADLVRHGENGLIVPAGDSDALVEAVEWCINHRSQLRQMRQAALETAAQWQWLDYRKLISNIVSDCLRNRLP